MNTVLRPAGPQPARVYWVRRLVLLAALLAAIGLVWALVARGGDDGTPSADGDTAGQDADGQDAAGAAGPEDAEGSAQDAGADASPAACGPETLTVTLTAEESSYAAGQTPTFTITFTNTGEVSCVVDAGAANQALVITSGSDRIWSSADCATEGGTRTLLLPPGGQDQDAVAWPRVRSDETCRDDLPEPRAGTYTAAAVLGGVQSESVVFQLD